MVKSLVSKLSSASSNLSLASTLSSVSASVHGVGLAGGSGSGLQETNYLKHRNDPGRFFGDGVQFKAKLIGILEVGEARGDRMCQEALQDLKMAIRAAGEHKQRITIHVTIDGLRLRDEKTGDSLYHHPVHKISFIAQDMTDSRAFGYIFGSPDSGHRFFGIKTDKAASQVVLAMRDLFQVVFELKKKEIELARQQIQSKSIHDHQTLSSLASLKTTASGHNDLSGGAGPSSLSMLSSFSAGATGNIMKMGYGHDSKTTMSSNIKEMSPESVADLVDLEQELSSIQRGITQMERITPNDSTPTLGCSSNSKTTGMDEDPFGDSFTNFPTYNLLPPPESSRSRAKPNKPPDSNNIYIKTSAAGSGSLTAPNVATISRLSSSAAGTLSSGASPANVQQDDDDSWLNELDQQNDVFDTSKAGLMGISVAMSSAPLAPSESSVTPPNSQLLTGPSGIELQNATNTTAITGTSDAISISSQSDQIQSLLQAVKSDAFTDLDPLGTGRTRPYVDKKYFFQELKNPPKRVLKDLSMTTTTTAFSNNTNGSNNNIALDNVSIDELMQKVELFDLTASSAPEVATDVVTTATTMLTAARAFEQSSYSQAHHHHPPPPSSTAHHKVTNTLTGTIGSAAELISLTATTTTKTTKPNSITCATNTNSSLTTSTTSSITTKPFKLQFPTTSSFVTQTNFNLNNYNLDSCPVEVEATADATLSSTGTGADPVMLPRDTDPFSPTRKKSDPFQEGDLFSNMDPFEFEFTSSAHEATKSIQQQEQQNQRSSPAVADARKSADVFNGPLQVSLPPESAPPTLSLNASGMGNNTSVRSRPSSSSSVQLQTSTTNASAATSSSSVFKQQTVDVISSISNKKMPHLFGQSTRFSKRDSNNINMRRLQESDSLSENEAAPEPPPRPDSVSHAEPPPLPPKKQFSDIVIRPRSTTSSAANSTNRYEFLSTATKISASQRGVGGSDVPPIPLPSRRVGRSDGAYPGPGRPRKPGHTEDDYLAPIGSSCNTSMNAMSTEVPPLLPPPTQISTRTPRMQRQQQAMKSQDIYENKLEILQQQRTKAAVEATTSSILPDITLSQLLTLGIDELAIKLNVPTSKLSTMTLVELTAYLAEFIEKSKPLQSGSKEASKPQEMTAIFKVNFDQEATFVATFDDNFGEEQSAQQHAAFIANFEQFNEQPVAGPHPSATSATPAVPPADRYAVFREIIDQELQQQQQDTDLLGDMLPEEVEVTATDKLTARRESLVHSSSAAPYLPTFDNEDDSLLSSEPPKAAPPKIDTKITAVVAQAKDRYAALRDIILVENLFDKQATGGQQFEQQPHHLEDFAEFTEELNEEQDLKQYLEHDERAASRGFTGTEATSSALTIEDDDDDDADDDEDGDGGAESSMDSNGGKGGSGLRSGRGNSLAQDQYEKLSTSTQQLELEKSDRSSNSLSNAKQDSKFLMVSGTKTGLAGSNKDDLEIDDLMQRAISNLSLESRERLSPATTTPVTMTTVTDAATAASSPGLVAKSQFNDVSTSPIPVPSLSAHSQSAALSAQLSPIPVQLTAVSKLIDSATKQISLDQSSAITQPKESWATFDSPKVSTTFPTVTIERTKQASRSQRTAARRRSKSPKAITLHLPPPPPSNASPNDTAESPCSSDPRDDGWSKCGRRWPKHDRAGLGGGVGSNAPQTSSSSRDLSPWDDEAPQDAYPKQRRGPGGAQQLHTHTDRHGYYMRHARRMNSCDEDYDYDEEFIKRRDHRKLKQGISRSRDNFEFESPNWYHHPQQHSSWSPQDEDSPVTAGSRARSFDRSTYERTTYGPPIYDKRGVALPPTATSSYDRRSGGGYDKRKYYREYARPNYDFDGYGEPPHPERRGRRDYENIYDIDNRSPMGGYSSKGSRGGDYIYERDRKSFDRESVESFDSATRRRRSFGSGDVYGSLESREEFRERYMGGSSDPKATRSLRKGAIKMSRPTTADIDYEQDSDINEFHQQQQRSSRGPPLDTRSLQRPSQLVSVGNSVVGVTQQRVRKSSGSSPWDGEEPMPHMGSSSISSVPTVQKAWKRPSSAAESERRLAESRRAAVLAQTPSGSDGEKDRRFRKKQRLRGKDMLPLGATAATRYQSGVNPNVPVHPRDNYDYITYANDDDGDDIDDDDDYADEEYDEPPTDEDKFERLNRRRHEMHQRMLESEQRRQHHSIGVNKAPMAKPLSSAAATKIKYTGSARASDFVEFDDFQTTTSTPRSVVSSSICASAASTGAGTKFSFDDQGGFESDFNQSTSPPPAPAGTASSCNSTPAAITGATTTPATKSSFRFSNDFSEREKMQHFGSGCTQSTLHQFELADNVSPLPAVEAHVTPTPITQKLRFDDNVKISKFDNDSKSAFEDDFAKAEFNFEKTDQWSADALQAVTSLKKNHMRNSKLQQRQELIKKSESINIFAKKSEDPFEDDEFFNAPEAPELNDDDKTQTVADSGGSSGGGAGGSGSGTGFQWDNNDNNFAKFDENM